MTTPANRISAVLLLIIVLLAGVIAAELYLAEARDFALTDKLVAPGDVPSAQSESRFVPPDIGEFPEVLERPLFFRDRKLPPEPEPAPVAAAPLLPLSLTLEGVAIAAESRVAVLRNTSSKQFLQLTEGMSYNGWLLESISADRATFKRGAQVTELLLDGKGRNGRR